MSQLKTKPPKYCKCGHDRIFHITNKTFKFTGSCQRCPCNDYCNRERPNRGDRVLLVYGIAFISIFMYVMLEPFLMFTPEELETPIEIPIRTVYVMVAGLLGIMCIWLAQIFIVDYFVARKRRSFPIE